MTDEVAANEVVTKDEKPAAAPVNSTPATSYPAAPKAPPFSPLFLPVVATLLSVAAYLAYQYFAK